MLEFLFSEEKLIEKLFTLSNQKKIHFNNNLEFQKILEQQRKLLAAFLKKEKAEDVQTLREISLYLENDSEFRVLEQISRLNSSQKNVLVSSLKEEINKISSCIKRLELFFEEQKSILSGKSYDLYQLKQSVLSELEIIQELKSDLLEEKEFKNKIKVNLDAVKELEHTDWIRSVLKGSAKVLSSYHSVVVFGLENIPKTGAVVLAPRHYKPTMDPSVIKSIVSRETFFLSQSDVFNFLAKGISDKTMGLIKSDKAVNFQKWYSKKEGMVLVNRPDSPYEKIEANLLSSFKGVIRLLMLDQAVVIFPEGYGIIDPLYTPAKPGQEFLEIKSGIFHYVDIAQKKKGRLIPIIPIGLHYENHQKFRSILYVRIGSPIYIPLNNKDRKYGRYADILASEIKRLSKP